MAWEQRIAAVLAAGGPRMVYQPIVSLWAGTVVGWEALARFPTGTPDAWFKAAGGCGLGHELELSAISNALRTYREARPPGYLSINASPTLLTTQGLYDLDLCGVQVELTENDPVTDYPMLVRQTNRLRRNGATLAIDDVGSGYGSLRHVMYLFPDTIKIDRELVTGLHNVEEVTRRAVLRTLAYLANALQLDVVCEGIETADEAIAARSLGFNYGQGYHFSRPIEADDLPFHGG